MLLSLTLLFYHSKKINKVKKTIKVSFYSTRPKKVSYIGYTIVSYCFVII